MSIHIDPKGKVFTHVVHKNEVPALIQTSAHRIHGHIYVYPENRLLDELNQADQFIAVTQAIVMDAAGQELYRSNFLSLNRAHIVWVLPEEEPHAPPPDPEVDDDRR